MFRPTAIVLAAFAVMGAVAATAVGAEAQAAKGQPVVIANVALAPHGQVSNIVSAPIPMQNYCGLVLDGVIRGDGTTGQFMVEQTADPSEEGMWFAVGSRTSFMAPRPNVSDPYTTFHTAVLPVTRSFVRVTVEVNHGIDPAPRIGLKIIATPEPCGLFP